MTKRGRPNQARILFKIPVGFKLPTWVVEWLRNQETPQSQLIEHALINTYKIRPSENPNFELSLEPAGRMPGKKADTTPQKTKTGQKPGKSSNQSKKRE